MKNYNKMTAKMNFKHNCKPNFNKTIFNLILKNKSKRPILLVYNAITYYTATGGICKLKFRNSYRTL